MTEDPDDDDDDRNPKDDYADDATVRAKCREILDERFAGWLPDVTGPRMLRTRDWTAEVRGGSVEATMQTGLRTVAQFWNDNASDEVHIELLLSCASGWVVELAGGRARVTRRGYLRDADGERLALLEGALRERVTRVASTTWAPQGVD
ncbi:MAG: hypothetical protein H0T89_29920 [Deltaproteobacteria bacterium]|nr:hypothetical protein [Deltaproteobacteria bacterium]